MDNPFEIPFNNIEDAPPSRRSRLLRPYIEKLIQTDSKNAIHSNSYNRFNAQRDTVKEETFEYWISDDNIADDSDLQSSDLEADEILGDHSPSQYSSKPITHSKKRKVKPKITHDAQLIHTNTPPFSYEFNSKEICHIRQQMYLSLEQKSKTNIPPEIRATDIRQALVSLSGYECPPQSVYFNNIDTLSVDSLKGRNFEQVSFLKYLSRLLDTLFYISLYKENWNQCFKIFSILISTFDTDIYQLWPLGIHILCELNASEFEKCFHHECMKSDNVFTELPKLSHKILNELSFLRNPLLVPLICKEIKDKKLLLLLQRTVSQKRSTFDTIIKFLKLLMRTSRNQQPLVGAYPEQEYVPGGVLLDDTKEENIVNMDNQSAEIAWSSRRSETFSLSLANDNHNEFFGSESETNSSSSFSNESSENEMDDDSKLESQEAEKEKEKSKDIGNRTIVKISNLPIIIKNDAFTLGSERRRPHQHIYMTALKQHSAPLHRLGSRVRTPSYTLSYLWMLVRTGSLNIVQRALEPLLLIIPTSTDARVELADLSSRILDIAGFVNEINQMSAYEWEKITLIESKMKEINETWKKWKDQYARRTKKKRKGVKQFEYYEKIEASLLDLNDWVASSIEAYKMNRHKNKPQRTSVSKDSSTTQKSDSSDNSDNSDHFLTAEEDNSNIDHKTRTESDDSDTSEGGSEKDVYETVRQDDEDIDEDEEEVRKEMERLIGYSTQGDAYDDSQMEMDEKDDEEDDEEVQREMQRLLGYSNNEDPNFNEYNDGFNKEDEQFYNEFETNLPEVDSDSDQ